MYTQWLDQLPLEKLKLCLLALIVLFDFTEHMHVPKHRGASRLLLEVTINTFL